MHNFFERFSIAYLAGALGGLAYALIAWACDHWALFEKLSVKMSVGTLSWPYLAERLLYGSLWALLLVLLSPWLRARGAIMGVLISLLPSAYVLMIEYPNQGLGMMGSAKGTLAWLFVLLFNATWGFIAGGIYSRHFRA